MKSFFFFLFFILICRAGFSQEVSEEKNYISAQVGAAIPIGFFIKDHARMKPGLVMALEYMRILNSNWEIGGMVGFRQNETDTKELERRLHAPYIHFDSYRTTFLLANLKYRLGLSENFNIFSKLSLGGSVNVYPYRYYQFQAETVLIPEDKAFSVATGLGVGLQYKIGKIITGLELHNLATIPHFAMRWEWNSDSFFKLMSTSNLNVNVGYSF